MPDTVDVRLPLVEEQLSIERRAVETDRVRIRGVVDTEQVLIEDSVQVGRLSIERVSMDREVVEAPAQRQEGDTTIIAMVEERLVVEKRLFVIEEIRITRSSHNQLVSTPVSLRRMRAVIERRDTDLPPTERS